MLYSMPMDSARGDKLRNTALLERARNGIFSD